MKRGLYPHRTAIGRQTPQALRHGWRHLIVTAQELASPAAYRPGLRVTSIENRLLDFKNLLREARLGDFPVEGASVSYMAEGFVKVGRAFAEAGSPELREILGSALAACAEALIEILDGARDAAAQRRNAQIMGERLD